MTDNKNEQISWWYLIPAILIPQVIGNLGAIYTIPNINTWYAALTKPAFNTPNFIFGPVWFTLYTLMGIAIFLIWRSKGSRQEHREANQIFIMQLVLNLGWSVVFFGMQEIFWALIIILILLAAVITNIIYFYRLNQAAAWLLVPYLMWGSFATVLNFAIWQLN